MTRELRSLEPLDPEAVHVLYYWAPFLAGAALTVGVLVALVVVARRSAVVDATAP